MRTVFLTLCFLVMAYMDLNAQTTYEWKKPPMSTEIEVGVVTLEVDGGHYWELYSDNSQNEDRIKNYTDENLYEKLLETAKQKYAEQYPKFVLRNFKSSIRKKWNDPTKYSNMTYYSYDVSATVVVTDPKLAANENLSIAIDKALRNVREGARLAIDNVSVPSGTNREDYKDNIVDVLLDKGYKVVAKEYLEKLYEEQQKQQSGIYNDKTTVQENNFSAIGYYINVKVTESSVRVSVVNVSTGEYEGNATITF